MIVIGDKSVHPTAWEILDSPKLGPFPAFWDGPTLFSYCRVGYDCGLPRTLHARASTPSMVIRAGESSDTRERISKAGSRSLHNQCSSAAGVVDMACTVDTRRHA
jgi:hypothetical protein